ncbi:carbohydrate esterase-like sialic acid-specific acetylesterase [Kribbella amoyensis]|uniref:Carbohydrate esterase-like sialic acid-specific acetylesterase n=1 Tax=Kribbella amoyensis TaxID=996641 RepID=A0A561C0C4_9ACTN|nr:sialate O-acetylesterase [Kribbella amoyensis]TWD84639.1 carbohydrate esterase-like sialic acid-specific acetylesterase [Kribbella amoyensis]
MSRHRLRTGSLVIGSAALAFASAIVPASGIAAAEPTDNDATSNSCDAEAAGYQPVRGLDLPTAANWREVTPPYTFDETADVAGGFDRVGYCLELTTEAGTSWVWTSMEALSANPGDVGLPTRMEQARHQFVDDLTVASNVPGVQQLDGGSGWVEMWPNQYDGTRAGQVPGASETARDADDHVLWANGYGSFQVHAFADARDARGPAIKDAPTATPVLAVNAFTSDGPQTMDVGIGTGTGENPDWTGAANAADYTARKLTFFARPSLVKVDTAPSSRQVVSRPGRTATSVSVPVSGEALDPDVTAVELRTTRNGRQTTQRAAVSSAAPRFSFSVSLPVALTSTDFELVARTADGGSHRIGRAVDVVAGDVIVIQGQSNAQAGRQVNSTTSDADRSRWVRTYGTSNNNNSRLAGAIGGWTYGMGDNIQRVGAIGQWAVRMGQLMSAELRIPIAVVNGARGGRGIGYFARNDSNPTDGTTSYGMLLNRLTRAGLAEPGAIDVMLWHQGEADRDNAASHVTGFTKLVADWRKDYGADLPVYVHQVRSSPCDQAEPVALRDAQRRLPDTIANLRVLSTTGLNGHVGCHYDYIDGYRTFGEHNAAMLLDGLYRPGAPKVAAPNPGTAHRIDDNPNQLVVELRTPADPVTVEDGAAADFQVPGAVVEAVRWQRGRGLVLTLDRPVPADTTVAYLAHHGAGPRVVNALGIGLLAFRIPIG